MSCGDCESGVWSGAVEVVMVLVEGLRGPGEGVTGAVPGVLLLLLTVSLLLLLMLLL